MFRTVPFRQTAFNKSRSVSFQPVGFVTFQTRAGAEAAKQDLQVKIKIISAAAEAAAAEGPVCAGDVGRGGVANLGGLIARGWLSRFAGRHVDSVT